jgi:nicotinamide mononucleotide transporter PnuC
MRTETIVKKLNKSVWYDLLGVAIIIATAYASGYLFNDLTRTAVFANAGGWAKYVPFGIISATSSVLSVMSTRLTSKQNNLGNVLGIINTVTSGVIDFVLGNVGAILTYPVTFIINAIATRNWRGYGDKVNDLSTYKKWFPAMIVGAFGLSFGLNYLAFQTVNMLFIVTSLVFALSLVPNIMNMFKIKEQWGFWAVYNVIQLVKAVVQGNFANVGKYVYYIVNSLVATLAWRH